jgi:hypothetical protein
MKDSMLPLKRPTRSVPSNERNGQRVAANDMDHSSSKYRKRRSVKQTAHQLLSRPTHLLFGSAVLLGMWYITMTRKNPSRQRSFFAAPQESNGGLRKKVESLWAQRGDAVLASVMGKIKAGTTITRLQHFEKMFFEGQTKRNSLGDTITILESWLQDMDQQIRANVVGGVHWVRPNLLPPIPGDDTPQEYGATDKDGKGDRKREFVLVDRMNDPRGPMAWESEWRELQAAGVDGPRVDYRRRDKYIYPEIILEPPDIGYPKLQTMKDLMQNWPQDEDYTGTITETLMRFNFSNPVEREAARKFRDVELPFKIYDIPEIDQVTKLWTDDYVSRHFDDPHRNFDQLAAFTQESTTNFFSFYVWWDSVMLGLPPDRHNDWTFAKWAEHARYADAKGLAFDQPHFYYQAGIDKTQAYLDKKDQTIISTDLPSFSGTTETFFVFHPEEQHGMQCRFGERGVAAAQHQDPGRNMIAMLTGAKRYILSPPRECSKFGIFPTRVSPLYRHSSLNFEHLNRMDDPDMPAKERAWLERAATSEAVETVLKEGEVLYLPSHWFHYIVSLQKSGQCNVRSGTHIEGRPEFGGMKDIEEC